MFNKYFVWVCEDCGNLNTYDPFEVSSKKIVADFGESVKCGVLHLCCHHCFKFCQVSSCNRQTVFTPVDRSVEDHSARYFYTSEPITYHPKIACLMKDTGIESKAILKADNSYWYSRLSTQIEVSCNSDIIRNKNSLLSDKNSSKICYKVRVRNIFEYFSLIWYLSGLCRVHKINHKLMVEQIILPSDFHFNDYLIELRSEGGVIYISSKK